MRSFVAIEISESVKRRIRERMERGKASLPNARWVDPQLLHLTLVFLGETPESDLLDLEVQLLPIFKKQPAFDLELFKGGTFPPNRSARVAWIGVDGGAALIELQREVANAVSRVLGKEGEAREFHGHVTLARCRAPWKRYAVDRYHALMSDFRASVRVREGVLMASEMGTAGTLYTRVCKFDLSSA